MNSQIYYIKPSEKSSPSPNWMNEQLLALEDTFKSMPLAGKIVAGGAGGAVLGAGIIVLAPVEATFLVLTAGAALSASVFAVVTGFVGNSASSEPTTLNREKDAEIIGEFEENSGIRLFNGQYYISHPRNDRKLISCQNFYHDILSEQTSDIIAMIRNELPAKEIAIEITTNQRPVLGSPIYRKNFRSSSPRLLIQSTYLLGNSNKIQFQ